MSTILKLGPADHGRPLTLEEFEAGEYQGGYHYELINGRLSVSPVPDQPENSVEDWLFFQLKLYAHQRPEVINFVTVKARVFVPDRPDLTAPEPDISAYRDYPLARRFRDVRWQDVSPVLVVEVLSEDDPDKDLVRNVELYWQVPSIREYWTIDTRAGAEQPSLRVHRRHGQRWVKKDVAAGESYTTRLLPGFELVLDPLR
jgi:Uma2 family endonuclease